MFRTPKAPTPQDPLCNVKTIKFLASSLVWWAYNLLDVNMTIFKIAQTYVPTQRHMTNGWSKKILCYMQVTH